MSTCGVEHPHMPGTFCNRAEHSAEQAHSVAGIAWMAQSLYVPDQEAVDWARMVVMQSVAKFRNFESQARQKGEPDKALRWRFLANAMERDLIGGGCIIGPFHEQVVKLRAELQELRDA